MPRVVVPGLPHRITQRGNRRQQTFFCAQAYEACQDYQAHLELMAEWCARRGVEAEAIEEARRHERTGRPLGSDGFVARLERRLGRALRPQKPGPKPTAEPR